MSPLHNHHEGGEPLAAAWGSKGKDGSITQKKPGDYDRPPAEATCQMQQAAWTRHQSIFTSSFLTIRSLSASIPCCSRSTN